MKFTNLDREIEESNLVNVRVPLAEAMEAAIEGAYDQLEYELALDDDTPLECGIENPDICESCQ